MKRILIYILLILPLMPLFACAKNESPLSQLEQLGTGEPTELPFLLPALEMQLNEEPAAYEPITSIVPLTNETRIYNNCVVGETVFIRADDQSRVELPPETKDYVSVKTEDGTVLAYALLDNDYLLAFMNTDGAMLTDFIYTTFGEDNISFPNYYGYVTVMKALLDSDGNTMLSNFGLLDLRTGREAITTEYDSIQPLKYGVLAEKNGRQLLLDYTGKLLFEFEEQININYGNQTDNPWLYLFTGAGYTYIPETGELFSHALEADQSIQFYDGMTIATQYSDIISDEYIPYYEKDITVYDQSDVQVFAGTGIREYYVSEGAALFVYKNTTLDIVRPSGSISINVPEMDNITPFQTSYAALDGDNIVFTYTTEEDPTLEHSIVYNEEGSELRRYDEQIYTAKDIRLRYLPQYSQQLEDSSGNILIPFGVYDYINVYGSFIIGSSAEIGSTDFDILNLHCEVLLHNPLGAIILESGLTDKMVVWQDNQTCIFLFTDGSTEPITNPPKVERKYIGG